MSVLKALHFAFVKGNTVQRLFKGVSNSWVVDDNLLDSVNLAKTHWTLTTPQIICGLTVTLTVRMFEVEADKEGAKEPRGVEHGSGFMRSWVSIYPIRQLDFFGVRF